MNPTALKYLMLDGVPADAARLQLFRAAGGDAIDGVLWLDRTWYRIEDGILDVLPPGLRDDAKRDAFAARYGIAGGGVSGRRRATDDERKAEQIEFFRRDSVNYDRDISNRSFYMASDRIAFGDWLQHLGRHGLVCDIGAGSGRLTIPLAERGLTVISTDISEDMLRLSRQRAMARGVADGITYVVADAERLPCRDGLFDAATCYGALHHVPNPQTVVAQAARILRPGGRWLSYDPHASTVRFVFDWAMRVKKLYSELASRNPLITRQDAAGWCRNAGLDADLKLHFFLPPHVLTMVSADVAERCLRTSDRLCNRLGLGALAGVVIVWATKPLPAGAGAIGR